MEVRICFLALLQQTCENALRYQKVLLVADLALVSLYLDTYLALDI